MKQIVDTEKGPIECKIVGQGSPILLLNGMHTNCDSPVGSQQFFLDRGYQLIIPSRPGYGHTPLATGRSAEAFADALACLLDVLDLEKVIVVAISGGGRTALQFAARHPHRLCQLILQCAVVHEWPPERSTKLLAYIIFNPLVERGTWAAFRLIARLAPTSALAMMVGGISKLKPRVALNAMTARQQKDALNFLLASRSGAGFLNDLHQSSGDLSRVTVPTLVITSPYDKGVDISHAAFAVQYIQHASLFISQAESHLLWFSPHNVEIEQRMHTFLGTFSKVRDDS